ncbi:Tm-1-like ATP-binding domain-containing protein [Microlunatus soli]|uniref:Uncharacterized protein, UPF0261 family n=1 Tax=Microlunatus soli TaxID=630515 RepID=A0A1H1YMN6_9ACTN|nr:Tm-1-like ATP-binding domain-containing protein [Microlunatus soli]SDT22703.1 Uncharacterized protein, UPF0261 family [Microlunatus soli]
MTELTIALVGALDTKGAEYGYLREMIERLGAKVIMIDVGVLGEPAVTADLDRARIADLGGGDLDRLRGAGDRGAAMQVMALGAGRAVSQMITADRLDAVLTVGGSNAGYVMGEVATHVPIGFPKLLVSTIAAGDTRPYVRATDVTLTYPVVDINGLNRITRPILANAAHACVGMAGARNDRAATASLGSDRMLVAVTMFGVTTAAGTATVNGLAEHQLEGLTFHCTGVGGSSMETLIRAGLIAGVADLTTTELADDLVGGVCTAGPDRLTAAGRAGIPQVVSVGALDMINFGAPETVPARFADRNLLAHNPAVTLMRTDPDEATELGRRLAAKLNDATGPVTVLFPHGGLSQLSVPGGPFADPVADRALYGALRAGLRSGIELHDFDTDINDPAIATTAVELLAGWLEKENT